MGSILYATFREGKDEVVYTKKAYQHDRGVTLRLSGIALPEKYQVHFSNDERDGVTAALWVSGSDVKIPDAYLETGKYVYVWVYFAEDGHKVGNSERMVIIPVEKRPAILQVNQDGGGLVVGAYLEEDEHTLVFQ